MSDEKLKQFLGNENFSNLILKIYKTLETKESFEFTFEDAKAFGNMGRIHLNELADKPKLELDDFPDVIGSEATGENMPENFPVNLPQPVIQAQIEPMKPILTILKSKDLETLIQNVNSFNHSKGIQIISTLPIQQFDGEFVKEICYFDFETVNREI